MWTTPSMVDNAVAARSAISIVRFKTAPEWITLPPRPISVAVRLSRATLDSVGFVPAERAIGRYISTTIGLADITVKNRLQKGWWRSMKPQSTCPTILGTRDVAVGGRMSEPHSR
jgi:hypothetical protein